MNITKNGVLELVTKHDFLSLEREKRKCVSVGQYAQGPCSIFQLTELEMEDQRRMGRKVISQILYSSLLQKCFVEVFSCS